MPAKAETEKPSQILDAEGKRSTQIPESEGNLSLEKTLIGWRGYALKRYY
jgi:hypothetical protein